MNIGTIPPIMLRAVSNVTRPVLRGCYFSLFDSYFDGVASVLEMNEANCLGVICTGSFMNSGILKE